MAITKAKTIREYDMAELQLRAAELQKEMFDIRQRLVTKEEQHTALLGTKKREYARLLTVMNEKNRSGK